MNVCATSSEQKNVRSVVARCLVPALNCFSSLFSLGNGVPSRPAIAHAATVSNSGVRANFSRLRYGVSPYFGLLTKIRFSRSREICAPPCRVFVNVSLVSEIGAACQIRGGRLRPGRITIAECENGRWVFCSMVTLSPDDP